MSNTTASPSAFAEDQYQRYRELNMTSVVSLLLGLVALTAFVFPAMAILALAGLLAGWGAIRAIRRRPEELSGMGVAKCGVGLSLISLLGGISLASYVYTTEVPDGFQRISFTELQPDKQHPELPVPPAAIDLDGQKIFIKGYIYPDNRQGDLTKFVLVPDMGTCCFGGQPKLTDMIEVTLEDPLRVQYSFRKQRLAGVLRVDKRLKPVNGLQGVYYQLRASYVN